MCTIGSDLAKKMLDAAKRGGDLFDLPGEFSGKTPRQIVPGAGEEHKTDDKDGALHAFEVLGMFISKFR